MDLPTFIFLAGELNRRLPRPSTQEPDFLPGRPLALFRRFKAAYDTKDAAALARCIAPRFKGDFHGARTKRGLMQVFAGLFGQIPLARPNLTIELYRVVENSPKAYEARLAFHAHLTLAGVTLPFTDYDDGVAASRLEPQGRRGIWQITKLNHEKAA